eukprot:gene2403-2884_t
MRDDRRSSLFQKKSSVGPNGEANGANDLNKSVDSKEKNKSEKGDAAVMDAEEMAVKERMGAAAYYMTPWRREDARRQIKKIAKIYEELAEAQGDAMEINEENLNKLAK